MPRRLWQERTDVTVLRYIYAAVRRLISPYIISSFELIVWHLPIVKLYVQIAGENYYESLEMSRRSITVPNDTFIAWCWSVSSATSVALSVAAGSAASPDDNNFAPQRLVDESFAALFSFRALAACAFADRTSASLAANAYGGRRLNADVPIDQPQARNKHVRFLCGISEPRTLARCTVYNRFPALMYGCLSIEPRLSLSLSLSRSLYRLPLIERRLTISAARWSSASTVSRRADSKTVSPSFRLLHWRRICFSVPSDPSSWLVANIMHTETLIAIIEARERTNERTNIFSVWCIFLARRLPFRFFRCVNSSQPQSMPIMQVSASVAIIGRRPTHLMKWTVLYNGRTKISEESPKIKIKNHSGNIRSARSCVAAVICSLPKVPVPRIPADETPRKPPLPINPKNPGTQFSTLYKRPDKEFFFNLWGNFSVDHFRGCEFSNIF